jgi:3'-5' exonuclease
VANENYFMAFDIETIPLDWDSFSESQQEYLIRNAQTEEEIQKKKNEMALAPLTAKAVCIGIQIMKPAEDGTFELINKGALALDESLIDSACEEKILETGDVCKLYNEKMMLEQFWRIINKYRNVHLISFNGRNFDAPFLMLRSALLGIKPSRNLMSGTKFNYSYHTDLLDELTFYIPQQVGATRRFNFDFYTRAFGLVSPKSAGVDGSKVAEYFHNGKILEIAEYCLRDVYATWELFRIWREFLAFRD